MADDYKVRRPLKRAPIHPGEILREDVLPALQMTIAKASADLGITRQTLHRLLAGTTSITPEMAVRLGKFCGNGPELWINLQTAYDLWHAQQRLAEDVAKIPTRAA